MKIRAVVVENEIIQNLDLQELLNEYCPEIKVSAYFTSGQQCIQSIPCLEFEMFFLDIELGDMTAFELLEQLPDCNFQIIFTTAFDRYAVRAFKVNAVDYLVKPIDGKAVRVAVNKAIQRIQNTRILPEGIRAQAEGSHSISIPERDTYTIIPCDKIQYCRSDGNYTDVFYFTVNGNIAKIVATKNLLHFEQKLCGNSFLRIHQSILINKHHVCKIHKSNGVVILSNGKQLEIARDRKKVVFQELLQ